MSHYDHLIAVKNSPLAAELDETQSRRLCKIMTLRKLSKGECLLQEGDQDHSLYLIKKGHVAVTKNLPGMPTETLHILHEGDVAGAMGFIDGQGHSASLCAENDAELLCLSRNDFEALHGEDSHLVYHVMRSLIRVVHDIVRQMNISHVEMANYITRQHGRH